MTSGIAVGVNFRDYVRKTLSRYPGKFFVFREFLQNSDDANSQNVEIYLGANQWTFKNDGDEFSDNDWKRLVEIASGNPKENKIGAFGLGFYSVFAITDKPSVISGCRRESFFWKEGENNLFHVPEALEPDQSDKWTTITLPLKSSEVLKDYNVFELVQFLTSSITFMVHLAGVKVFWTKSDSESEMEFPVLVAHITRTETARSVDSFTSESTDAELISLNGFMRASSIETKTICIKTDIDRCNYALIPTSTLENLPDTAALQDLTFRIFTAVVEVEHGDANSDSSQESEFSKLIRGLQNLNKCPPHRTMLDIIFVGKQGLKEITLDSDGLGSVFKNLKPDIEGGRLSKVYIGHATDERTGFGGHISGMFLTTSERATLDFTNCHAKSWNEGLLCMVGALAHAVYNTELGRISHEYSHVHNNNPSAVTEDTRTEMVDQCLHALKYFTFHPEPSNSSYQSSGLGVVDTIESAFYSCANSRPFLLVSSMGVHNANNIRLPDPLLDGFLKRTPILPMEIRKGAQKHVNHLMESGRIKNITTQDVLEELENRTLSEAELGAFMTWWIKVHKARLPPSPQSQDLREPGTGLPDDTKQFITKASFLAKDRSGYQQTVRLSSIKKVTNLKGVDDSPLPPHTLPLRVVTIIGTSSKSQYGLEDLQSTFGWEALTILDWLKSISSQSSPTFDICSSPDRAEQVLLVIAYNWQRTLSADRDTIALHLKEKTCIPTQFGMHKPSGVYLTHSPAADFPTVKFPGGPKVQELLEPVLIKLGIKKSAGLMIECEGMAKTPNISPKELIKHILQRVPNWSSSESDIDMLQNSQIFLEELSSEHQISNSSIQDCTSPSSSQLYVASDLYEPLDIFRKLKLRIIKWGPQKDWEDTYDEERQILYRLGLQRFPPLQTLLGLAGDSNPNLRKTALTYFLDNNEKYSEEYDPQHCDIAFIPLKEVGDFELGSKQLQLACPKLVFVDEYSGILGFPVVHDDLQCDASAQSKLKLKQEPEIDELLERLESGGGPNLCDWGNAKKLFKALNKRALEFTQSHYDRLSEISMVPALPPSTNGADPQSNIQSNSDNIRKEELIMMKPKDCYFQCIGGHKPEFLSKLFTFVNFGLEANTFLKECKTKPYPEVPDIMHKLLDAPRPFLEAVKSMDSYVELLHSFQEACECTPEDSEILTLNKRMENSTFPFLLALQWKQRDGKEIGLEMVSTRARDRPHTEDIVMTQKLLEPKNIVVIDGSSLHDVFGDIVYYAPQDDLVEKLYRRLGSRPLREIVEEKYKHGSDSITSDSLTDSDSPELQFKSFVLERILVFIHSYSRHDSNLLNKLEERYKWLKEEGNFSIQHFKTLRVCWELDGTHLGMAEKEIREKGISAIVVGAESGTGFPLGEEPVKLLVAGTAIDDFEVSGQLCKILFHEPKKEDIQILTMILSSDVQTLRKRRFNVESENMQYQGSSAVEFKFKFSQARERPGLPSVSAAVSVSAGPSESVPEQVHCAPTKKGLFRKVIGKVRKAGVQSHPGSSRGPNEFPLVIIGGGQANASFSNSTASETMIQSAIDSCRKEESSRLGNQAFTPTREPMRGVDESINYAYCTSENFGSLKHVGEVEDTSMRIYVTEDVEDGDNIKHRRSNTLDEFCKILQQLCKLFGLNEQCLHIFCDSKGPTIAFNRDKAIFCNLRYYEERHEHEISQGDPTKAYISWFYSIAHEIAHNVVPVHNSAHEFCFTLICEAYQAKFSQLLSTVGGSTQRETVA